MRRRCKCKYKYRYRTRDAGSISLQKAMEMIEQNEKCVLLDVRSVQEYREGHIPYSINIPHFLICQEIRHFVPNKNTEIICYCKTGGRSLRVAEMLGKMGYHSVYHIGDGVEI